MASVKRSPTSILLAAALVIFYRSYADAAGSTCYWPDGSTATGAFVCSPNNGESACCFDNDYCTTTGYCISSQAAYHYRSACTDKTWGSSSCPQGCLDGSNTQNHTNVNILACDDRNGSWCCAYDGPCCNDIWQHPPLGQLLLAVTSTISVSTSATAITPSTATTTVTATAYATMTAATETSTSNSVAVGAGVGVPLGILALAAIGYAIWMHRKSRAINNSAYHGQPETASQPSRWQQQGNFGQSEGTKFGPDYVPPSLHELPQPEAIHEASVENHNR